MRTEKSVGNYVFPQATLIQVAGQMVANMYRDKDEFAKLGISTTRFDEITNLVNAVNSLQKNHDLKEELKSKHKVRNQMHTDLVQLLDEIALFVEAAYGKKSEAYAKISFVSAGDKRRAADVTSHATHIYNVLGTDELFADFILPDNYLATLKDLTESLIGQNNTARLSDTDKQVVNKQRTDLMKTIYAKLTVLMSVGKRIWLSKEPAKYNDYVVRKAANSFLIRRAA